MGDGGAMFLGFLMATLGLKLRLENSNMLSAWAVPVLVLGATIFDTTLVTISRSRRGLLPFATPGKDHAAHRLANLGLGQRGAVLGMYILGALSWLARTPGQFSAYPISLGVLAFAIILAVAGIAFLERAPYERQTSESPQPAQRLFCCH
jgi:UDP-N-acetylmuramyl pentapeptide phosphotransferase/UDP-N-acetylglucosamine-1-phosphate transferase